MSDSVIATLEMLTDALKDSRYLFGNAERLTRPEGEAEVYAGDLRYPRQAAEELFGYLENAFLTEIRESPVLLPQPDGDPEVRAMQAIVSALAPFMREPPGPVERILRWACDRYVVGCPSCGGT